MMQYSVYFLNNVGFCVIFTHFTTISVLTVPALGHIGDISKLSLMQAVLSMVVDQ